jgi:hypothetical protein
MTEERLAIGSIDGRSVTERQKNRKKQKTGNYPVYPACVKGE